MDAGELDATFDDAGITGAQVCDGRARDDGLPGAEVVAGFDAQAAGVVGGVIGPGELKACDWTGERSAVEDVARDG